MDAHGVQGAQGDGAGDDVVSSEDLNEVEWVLPMQAELSAKCVCGAPAWMAQMTWRNGWQCHCGRTHTMETVKA